MEGQKPVNISKQVAVLKIVSQVEIEQQELHEVGRELLGVSRARHFGLRAELELVVTHQLHFHCEALRCPRVDSVAFLQLKGY